MKEYKRLEKGEIIQDGDEWDACENPWHDDAKWIPVAKHMIGREASDPKFVSHSQYRRKLNNS